MCILYLYLYIYMYIYIYMYTYSQWLWILVMLVFWWQKKPPSEGRSFLEAAALLAITARLFSAHLRRGRLQTLDQMRFRMQPTDSVTFTLFGGFLKTGVPQARWMVSFMENPSWMMTRATPILGHRHLHINGMFARELWTYNYSRESVFTDYTLAHPLNCRGRVVARLSA